MLDMWNESIFMEDEQDDFLEYQTSLTYDDLEDCGQPVRPLEFPTPVVYDGVFADIVAADHRTGVEYPLKNVLVRRSGAERAYLIKKKLAKSTYGSVKLAVVLERINDDAEEREGDNEDDNVFNKRAEWRSTGEFAVIKCSSWDKIQSLRGRHLVEPIKEISVLQLLGKGSGDNHVVGCLEVLQDDYFLYTIMPYCAGGDLMGKLEISGIQSYPDEDETRHYFKQLLSALVFLQKRGVCHRNICLENILLDDNDNLCLIDSGLALRIPYCHPSNPDCVTDVFEGTSRRLMRPQGQCGKLFYMAPEVLEQKQFDGHATDLWAAGVTLFVTLVGVAPFGIAQCSDKRFEKISQGYLKDLLQSQDVNLSPEAVDLLQNMFWREARDRLTLAEVMAHPWVLGQRFPVQKAPAQKAKTPKVEASSKPIISQPIVKECTQVEDMGKRALNANSITGTSNSKAQAVDDPATISTETKKHRRKLSGARDVLGKLKMMLPRRSATGCAPQQTSPMKEDWETQTQTSQV